MKRPKPTPADTPSPQAPQNPLKTKFLSSSSFQIHSVCSQLKSSPPSTSQLNNQPHYKHDSQLRQLVDSCQDCGQVIRLAYIASNSEVHIDQETLYFLQKYSTFQIAFIALIGEQQAGKSFAIDTLLNLASAQGNQFTSLPGEQREKGIYLWTIPFSYNFKRKIFVIQCSGLSFEQPLEREDQILLDLVNILASSLLVLHRSEGKRKRKNPIFEKEILSTPLQQNLIEELRKSSTRIVNETEGSNKTDTFWPRVLSCLYYSKIPPGIDALYEQLYNYCSFSHLPPPFLHDQMAREEYVQSLSNGMSGMNPLFVDRLSALFIELINKTTTKQYQNLKYTGNICCKLLINSIKYLNKKPKIKINKVFASILKELYQSSYEYHTDLYDDYLKEYFSKEEPFSFDDLIDAFRLSSSYAVDSFSEVVIEEKLHEEYESRLLEYIADKEELIIEINSKKTRNALKERIKQVENVKMNDIESIKAFMSSLNEVEVHLDHNRSFVIADRLLKYTKNIEKRIMEDRERLEREKIAHLQGAKMQKEQTFHALSDKNEEVRRSNIQNEKQFRKLVKVQTNHEATSKGLKKQIQVEKKYQKEYIVSKQSKKQYAQSLLEILREHQEKIRDNKKQMDEIYKEFEYNPSVLQLQKKIEDKEREIRELEKLESRIDMVSRNSALNSALQSRNSVVRSAIQKPKDPKQPGKTIKKLTVKK